MEGRSLSGYQQKRVWLNDGAGKFEDVAQAVGATDNYDGRSVALADLWNRGVLDVVVANQKGPLLIYKNTVAPENKWIDFELEGTASNRSAIGRRGQACSGTASSKCSRFPAAAASARRTSGGCILDWARIRRSRRPRFAGHPGKLKRLTSPAMGQVNKIKEPA